MSVTRFVNGQKQYLTYTRYQGQLILVSWQDEDHQILEIVWEKVP